MNQQLEELLKSKDDAIVIENLSKHRRLLWTGEWQVLQAKTIRSAYLTQVYFGDSFEDALKALTENTDVRPR